MAITSKDPKIPYPLPYKRVMNDACLAVAYFSEGGSENLRKFDQKMQNKPNLKKAKMKVIAFIERSYEKIHPFGPQKTKPKQTQFPGL